MGGGCKFKSCVINYLFAFKFKFIFYYEKKKVYNSGGIEKCFSVDD